MVTRAISGIFLLAILFSCVGIGGGLLFGFTLLISVIGFWELIRATKVRRPDQKFCGIEIVGYLGIIAYYLVIYLCEDKTLAMLPIILTIMGMLLVYVLTFPKYEAPAVMAAAFSFIYAPVFLSYIYLTRSMPLGKFVVWLIFCSSWACDTSAYCFGMLFGKHKLAPVLSPKKSIEGAVGGVFGAALFGFLYAFIASKLGYSEMTTQAIIAYPIISAIGSILSQTGDLAASGIKRNHDIKDYSHLIPGHGGIMDRFDSVIVTAPLVYFLVRIILL